MKSKFMSVKRIIMPLMQALILVQSITGCGVVNQQQFVELINDADDVSVELHVGQLADKSKEATVWMQQSGLNSLGNNDLKNFAQDFVGNYKSLKPAQTLMGVMSGNSSDQKYFVEPNAALSSMQDKSQEFQKTYTSATQVQGQIAPDQLKVNDTVQKMVKAALNSSLYYNTWQANFDGFSTDVAAGDYYNGSMKQIDVMLQVFNAVYGYESVPGDEVLYGEETADKIEAFRTTLGDLSTQLHDSEKATNAQKSLADSIDALLESSDSENTIRKVMYMSQFTDTNVFDNTTILSGDEASEKNVVDQMLFGEATKMEAMSIVYNVVRELSPTLDSSFRDKDYATANVSTDGAKDLNGNAVTVVQIDDLYKKAVTPNKGEAVQTERDEVSVVRDYQRFQGMNPKAKEVNLTTDQWAMYQDIKENTNILVNMNAQTTSDNRLLGTCSVTDLYGMLLGASTDMKGYVSDLQPAVDIVTGEEVDGDEAEETLEFDFDISVETYKVTQGVTEEELLADQAKKEGMFEWFYDGAVNYAQALMDKDNGCENVFLDEYIQWAGDKALAENPEAVPTPQPETDTGDTSGEWIQNPDGTTTFTGDLSELGMYDPTPEEAEQWKKESYEAGEGIAEIITSGEAEEMYKNVLERLAQEGYQP